MPSPQALHKQAHALFSHGMTAALRVNSKHGSMYDKQEWGAMNDAVSHPHHQSVVLAA